MRVTPRLCGARIWVDWTMGGPLTDRLWTFEGTSHANGEVIYQFKPYKRQGYAMYKSYTQVSTAIQYFRPFLIEPEHFLLGGPHAS